MTLPGTSAAATRRPASRRFRFALSVNRLPDSKPDWREIVVKADQLGFASILTDDHLGESKYFPIPAMAAAAGSCDRLRFGTIVFNNDFRHPALLAEDVVDSNDLLLNLDKPGQFGAPEHLAAMERVIAAAKAHGKWVGFGGDRNLDRQVKFIRDGVPFATTQSDFACLIAEATRITGELREKLGHAAGRPGS